MAKNSLKPTNPYKSEPENTEKKPKLPMMYYVAVILLLIGVQLAFFWSGSTREIPYSSFRTFVIENKVESVKIAPEKIYVTLKPGVDSGLPVVDEKTNPPASFCRTQKRIPTRWRLTPCAMTDSRNCLRHTASNTKEPPAQPG